MLTHPVFGRDPNLFNFLDLPNPPPRTKIKRGFLAGVKETLVTSVSKNFFFFLVAADGEDK
jgi:hypothetical protein